MLIVSQIVRGAFQSAYLGYYAHAEPRRASGYMGEAMTLAHTFGRLALHRLEANIQPGNARLDRARPLRRLPARGASRPRYLLIGGQWRDRERYTIAVHGR